jgi:hypothetical protein
MLTAFDCGAVAGGAIALGAGLPQPTIAKISDNNIQTHFICFICDFCGKCLPSNYSAATNCV